MKKMHKKVFLFLILSISVLFTACGEKEETTENLPPWTLEKYSYDGAEGMCSFLSEEEISTIKMNIEDNNVEYVSQKWDISTGEVSQGTAAVLEDAVFKVKDGAGETEELYTYLDFDLVRDYIYGLSFCYDYGGDTAENSFVCATIHTYDKSGRNVYNQKVVNITEPYEGIYDIEVDENGRFYLICPTESGYGVYLIDIDGSESQIGELDFYEKAMCTDEDLFILSAGEIYHLNEAKELEKIKNIEDADGIEIVNEDLEFDFAYIKGLDLYGYSVETEESSLIIKDGQMGGDSIWNLGTIYVESLESVWGIQNNLYEGTLLLHASPLPDAGDISDRTVIRYVKLDPLQFSIQSEIADFNVSNTEYYIETVDLSAEEDPLGTLSNRIAAGEKFDFVELSAVDYTSLANKGVLEDLNPYIANSDVVNPEDLEETFLNALETDGALYEVAPYCYFYTVCANTEFLEQIGVEDAKKGWNREQYIAYMQAVAPKASGAQLLANALPMDMDSFVNYSAGTCDFTNEDFYNLLESCNVGQTADMEENYKYVSELNTFRENHFLVLTLTPNYICEVQNYIRQSGDMALIGYPGEDGSGRALLSPALSFGMFAQSENKDVVWEFLEVFLSYDYQKKYEINFGALATRKDVVGEMFAMMSNTENFGDTYPYGQNRILGEDFGSVVVDPLTAEEVAEMETLIYGTNERYQINDTVYNIIMEEATAYFMGQKSVEEVAEIIENRVSVYMEE